MSCTCTRCNRFCCRDAHVSHAFSDDLSDCLQKGISEVSSTANTENTKYVRCCGNLKFKFKILPGNNFIHTGIFSSETVNFYCVNFLEISLCLQKQVR